MWEENLRTGYNSLKLMVLYNKDVILFTYNLLKKFTRYNEN